MHKETIYKKPFIILCISTMLFFISFNMLIPEFSGFITMLGGADYKGYIISLATITAAISRPFSGKLTDIIGRVPIIIFGIIICFISSLLYLFISSVLFFLLVRMLHGISSGFNPTATSAYVADITPIHKRGEALGIIGLFNSLGMSIGPFIGSKIVTFYGYDILFYTSAIMSLLSFIVILGQKETLPNIKEKFNFNQLRISPNEIIEKRVISPSIVLSLCTFSFGTILTIMSDFTLFIGAKPQNKGIFFSVFTISSLFIRLVAGKASDKYNRIVLIQISTFILTISMFLLGFVNNMNQLILVSILFGLSVGINSPTIFAWGIDLSLNERRGRALSTLFIALEIGIGVGAFLSAKIYNNQVENFKFAFWISSFFAFCASLYLFIKYSLNKKIN